MPSAGASAAEALSALPLTRTPPVALAYPASLVPPAPSAPIFGLLPPPAVAWSTAVTTPLAAACGRLRSASDCSLLCLSPPSAPVSFSAPCTPASLLACSDATSSGLPLGSESTPPPPPSMPRPPASHSRYIINIASISTGGTPGTAPWRRVASATSCSAAIPQNSAALAAAAGYSAAASDTSDQRSVTPASSIVSSSLPSLHHASRSTGEPPATAGMHRIRTGGEGGGSGSATSSS
eukprot:scaffold2882_cov100-Isochrysis_galbana.AAC.6